MLFQHHMKIQDHSGKKNKVFFWGILICLSCSCNVDVKTGMGRISASINESKEKKVFVQELYPEQKEIRINDTLNLIIEEAWIEKYWTYERSGSEIIVNKDDSIQNLILKFKDVNWHDYFNKLYILSQNHYGASKDGNVYFYDGTYKFVDQKVLLEIHSSTNAPPIAKIILRK